MRQPVLLCLRILFFTLAVSAGIARAELSLAPLFTDHAVLQCDKPVPVWGRADPGARVTVVFREQAVGATADDDGRWIVYLEPLAASAKPAELIVRARSGAGAGAGEQTARVADVLVGEVWLCSGQSNMEWPVNRAQNAAQEIAAANNPLIRHVAIRKQESDAPAERVATGGWEAASPATAGNFTAAGYFFARDLQPRLGVPVGLIHSSWGGTPVEAWMSASALASDPAFAVVGARWKKDLADFPAKKIDYDRELARRAAEIGAARAKGKTVSFPWLPQPHGPGHPDTPSGLFNGMIHPLLPYALRGALWYQGESNAGRAGEYHALFAAMIGSWRAHFGQPEFPFFWVQLANFKSGNASATEWAFLREAQAKTLSLPATGQAIAIDIGDPDDIHPRNKQEVGRRLALLARAQVYGGTVDCTGPVFEKAERTGSAMRVRFSAGAEGLTAQHKALQSFELAGADRKFHAATARIEHDTIVVASPLVKEPVAVRYAWRNAPVANLYNSAGLPAAPFRSDDW